MKLLDMTADNAADVLCTISPLIENIVNDEKIMAIIQKEIEKENITRLEAGFELARKIFTSIPLLMGDHREDVLGIIAAMNQKSLDDIRKQSLRDIIKQVKELFDDEELRAFFTSLSS